jgi:Flp pilus assembly protein TadD
MNIKQLHLKAQNSLNNQQYQDAHGALIAILQQDKFFADAYFLLGIIASEHSNNLKAIQLFEQALKLSINNPEYASQLAKHYALNSEHVKAKYYADLAFEHVNGSALILDTIGVVYSKVGLHHQAVNVFKQAVLLEPFNATYFFNLGVAQTFTGDFSNAQSSHEKVIELDPNFSKSYTALSSFGGVNTEHYNLTKLKWLFEQVSRPDDKLQIGHAIARECESLGDYDQSFKYLAVAKQAKLSAIDYDFSDDEAMFQSLFDVFEEDKSEILAHENLGFDNDEAIFIVGMPRSGTTLVERILSQHTDVTTAGELEYFGTLFKEMSKSSTSRILDQETITSASQIDFKTLGKSYIEYTRVLTGNTPKFIDKMPLNILYVGFILKALPNAKIVCLDRNPLDTIMSNFRQLFSANSYNYNYAYNLETLTGFYVLFNRLVKLWKVKFPNNFYCVDYEALVNSPEHEAKQLIGFCGLEWQDDCLSTSSNLAPVATASAVQVRQPINNKSVGNWKKYESYLGDIKQILSNANIL